MVQNNNLLDRLPEAVFKAIRPDLVLFSAAPETTLIETGSEIEEVLFPLDGLVALCVIQKSGACVETGKVGREGVIGAMAGLGLNRSHVRAVSMLRTAGFKIAASTFRGEVSRHVSLRELCITYNEALLDQAREYVVLNGTKKIETRFCRWLLDAHVRVQQDKLSFTQEFIAKNLSVRRTSITEAASELQKAGIIEYSRGTIRILNATALEERACK